MIQPIKGGCEHKLPGQYPAFEQDRVHLADALADLLRAGHNA